ncbi:MAG: SDR family NAD(P)-dependent oxidoreductase [Armatimonadota bacterium]
MSALRLDGKHAVVTGGASGIGQAIVDRLAEFGARVTVLDLTARDGFPFRIIPTDVSNPESVSDAFAAIDEIAPVDILVCSAGIGFVGNILGTTPEKFDQLMGVNARGVFLCNQQVIKRLTESGRPGAIVNICSIAAKVSLAERFAYSATKGAVLMMTKSIAQDYIHQGIRCNCVCPARVHTPFVDAYLAKNYPGQEAEKLAELSSAQPIGRMGKTSEIASMVHYLCSDEASYITGADYDVDGGTLAMR